MGYPRIAVFMGKVIYIIYNPLVRVLWGIPFSSLNPNEKQGGRNLFFGPRNHRLEVTVLKVINDILIRLMRAMVKTWLLLACGTQYQHFVSSPRKAQFQICHPYKSGESTGCLVVPTLGDGNQPINRNCDVDKTFFWIQSTPPIFWNQK